LSASVGDDFSKEDEAIFQGRRIDTAGLERASANVFSGPDAICKILMSASPLPPAERFRGFRSGNCRKIHGLQYVFLANIAPNLQRKVLQQVKKRPKLVALDTMNYGLERTPDDLKETLKHVDILVINDSRHPASNEHNLLRAAKNQSSKWPICAGRETR